MYALPIIFNCSGKRFRYLDDVEYFSEVSLRESALSRSHAKATRCKDDHDVTKQMPSSRQDTQKGLHDFGNFLSFERWLRTDGDLVKNETGRTNDSSRSCSVLRPESIVPVLHSKSEMKVPSPPPTPLSECANQSSNVLAHFTDVVEIEQEFPHADAQVVEDGTIKNSDSGNVDDTTQRRSPDGSGDERDGALETYLLWLENQTAHDFGVDPVDNTPGYPHEEHDSKVDEEEERFIGSPNRSLVSLPPEESPVPMIRHPRVSATTPYQPLSPYGKAIRILK